MSPLEMIARDLAAFKIHPSSLESVITDETRVAASPEFQGARAQYNEVFDSIKAVIEAGRPVTIKDLLRLDESANFQGACLAELYFRIAFVQALRLAGYSAEKIEAAGKVFGI